MTYRKTCNIMIKTKERNMSKPDHDDYVNEFYSNLSKEDISDALESLSDDDGLLELVVTPLRKGDCFTFGSKIRDWIITYYSEAADDYAREKLFENNLRPVL